VGVRERDFAIPNVYNHFPPILRDCSDLASSNFRQRLRPFAGLCRFFYFNDTRNGTRRDVLGDVRPKDPHESTPPTFITLRLFTKLLGGTNAAKPARRDRVTRESECGDK
jgi:hypothetical protein